MTDQAGAGVATVADVADANAAAARRIACSLVGEDPLPEEIARWLDAVAIVGLPLARARDRRLWALARRGSPWLGLVDAGLALADPYSPVRQRFYLMLAVLEASPRHVARFEAREASVLVAVLSLGARGVLGALRSACGLALVAALGARGR